MLDSSFPEPHRRWAGPGDRQRGWWLSLPLGIINGRVAGRQIAEQGFYKSKCNELCSPVNISASKTVFSSFLRRKSDFEEKNRAKDFENKVFSAV
jgi:hypothetical protein